jgi:hypothetical protein
MSTSTESTPATGLPSCKTLVDTLVGLGTSWAAHGLKVGRSALVTGAQTLGKTAETLDALAAAFEQKASAAKETRDANTADSASAADVPGADAPAVLAADA